MVVVFFKHGKGSGAGPINYVMANQLPLFEQDGSKARDENNDPIIAQRHEEPEVLRGDPELTRKIIDQLHFVHKYSSGVLSFTTEDTKKMTPEIERDIMDRFEETAFAGLDRGRYNITFVKHTEKDGSAHIHFVTPRVDLQSQKSLNIRPPGKQSEFKYDRFRDHVNFSYDMDDPDKATRGPAEQTRLEQKIYPHLAPRAMNNKHFAEALTDQVKDMVNNGEIKNYAAVEKHLRHLEKKGVFKITRQGKNYISLVPKGKQKAVRLRATFFKKGFNVSETPVLKPERQKAFLKADDLVRDLKKQILAGKIIDHAGVVKTLESRGYEITRQGENYMSLKAPGDQRATRYRSHIFHKGWSRPANPVKQEELLPPREKRSKSAESVSAGLRMRIKKDAAYNLAAFGPNIPVDIGGIKDIAKLSRAARKALENAEKICNALCSRTSENPRPSPEPARQWLDPAWMRQTRIKNMAGARNRSDKRSALTSAQARAGQNQRKSRRRQRRRF